jgi:hypothetical protein
MKIVMSVFLFYIFLYMFAIPFDTGWPLWLDALSALGLAWLFYDKVL